MRAIASVFLALSLVVVAACDDKKPEATKPVEVQKPVEAPKPVEPPAPPAPELPEPAGITAGGHKLGDDKAPKGKDIWAVDAAATDVAFHIVSNSASKITGKFPGGAAGYLDAKAKKGLFTIDLTKLATTNEKGEANPVRDANVLEAFFGARAPSNAATKDAVVASWAKLAGKIQNGVSKAGLTITGIEGDVLTLKDGATATGTVNGTLTLWDSVEVPVTFPVSATRTKDAIEVKSTSAGTFSIEKSTGSPVRKALFDTMLAAGCAHQKGIQNDVSIDLEKVTLHLAK